MSANQSVQGIESPFSFHLPTNVQFGVGSASRLGEMLLSMGVRRVFLVTDQGVRQAGLLDGVIHSLEEKGLHFQIYADVEPDPSLETIQAGAAMFQQQSFDCMVAIGGGSPIDTAKGIRVLAANGGGIGQYAGVNRVHAASAIPLIAIPTTSGTGSEVTIFGVYSDWENHVKITVTSPHMAPSTALIDPALTLSLPAKMTAATGIDALAHGIETFFSLRSSPASDALAIHAMKMIAPHLRRAVRDGADMEARIGMSQGSVLAGMAFNNGFLGLAHAIGSALSGHCHVPHGVAIGLLLPHVVAFNTPVRPEKAELIADVLGSVQKETGTAAELVGQLVRDIGLPQRLQEVGVPEAKLVDIAKDSFKSGMMKWNPRLPTEQEVLELLQKAF